MKYTTDKKEINDRLFLINERVKSIKYYIDKDMALKPLIYLGDVLKEYGDELKDLEKEYEALNRLLKYNKITWERVIVDGEDDYGRAIKWTQFYKSEYGTIEVWGGCQYDEDHKYLVKHYDEKYKHVVNAYFRYLKDAKVYVVAEKPQQSVK